MSRQPGVVRRLWFSWKMLQLPWRRRTLAGFDLDGNTYWEFKDLKHALRSRRVVEYPSFVHHSDVKVPPQWMQWLRHTRPEAPTIDEQQYEVARQARMKYLAAEADARWAAKPSAVDAPDKQQPVQMLESRDPASGIRQINTDQDAIEREEQGSKPTAQTLSEGTAESDAAPTLKKRKPMRAEPKDSPWKKAANVNPSGDWQPDSWTPPPVRKRA